MVWQATPWQERFWPYVDKTETCWLWRSTIRNGYGAIWDGTKHKYAHRLSYELHKGPIPDGYQIDHLCCVTSCINPEHLEAVTPEENQRRTRNRSLVCASGHEWATTPTYIDPKGYRHCVLCRRENEKGKWQDTELAKCAYCCKEFKPYPSSTGKLTQTCSVACANRLRTKHGRYATQG